VACVFNFASASLNFVWHFIGSADFDCSALQFSVAWHFRRSPHAFSFFARQAGIVRGAFAVLVLASSATTTRAVRPLLLGEVMVSSLLALSAPENLAHPVGPRPSRTADEAPAPPVGAEKKASAGDRGRQLSRWGYNAGEGTQRAMSSTALS